MDEETKLFTIHPFHFTRDTREHMSAVSFAVIGSSKSGKTTFIKHLLDKYFKDDIKVLFTQSLHNDIYQSSKEECCIAPGWIPDVVKECYNINKHTKNHYPFLMIQDDLVAVQTGQGDDQTVVSLPQQQHLGDCEWSGFHDVESDRSCQLQLCVSVLPEHRCTMRGQHQSVPEVVFPTLIEHGGKNRTVQGTDERPLFPVH